MTEVLSERERLRLIKVNEDGIKAYKANIKMYEGYIRNLQRNLQRNLKELRGQA